MAQLTLRGVRKRYGGLEVIKGVDLDVADRELVVFVGPSGCGKSTLLRLIAGLEELDGGEIAIDGVVVDDLPPARRGLAMVFQSYALYPHMTVYENMAFGLRRAGLPNGEVDRRVRAGADMLQIGPLLRRKPRDMSGGQRQRVAIGRAIVREPKVFLFDEPLSNLDASLRAEMRMQIAGLHHRLAATMVFVTHDQVEAMTLADRIVVLNAGQVEQVGAPMELYHRPRNLFVARFIGSPGINLLPGQVGLAHERGVDIALALGGPTLTIARHSSRTAAGRAVTVGVRPQHVRLAAGAAGWPAAVEVVERLGNEAQLHLRTPGGQAMMVVTEGDTPVRVGDELRFTIQAQHAHLFDDEGDAVAALPAGAPERFDPAISLAIARGSAGADPASSERGLTSS